MFSRSLHPFPARMAPEIALCKLRSLEPNSTVMDPMAGSGTVLRAASELGHVAIGFDSDPLAVLMSGVTSSRFELDQLVDLGQSIACFAQTVSPEDITLPWIDNDPETLRFIEFWFASEQIRDLRKLAFILADQELELGTADLRNALKLALSRIIVTKKKGASLAWDVSHSRPHKMRDTNEFDVLDEFALSCKIIAQRKHSYSNLLGVVSISRGDAKSLELVQDGSVDAVITSPPYLNAIDYMRGHKLALVWLGYSIKELRDIRSSAIGTERRLPTEALAPHSQLMIEALGDVESLPSQLQGVVKRYSFDLISLMASIRRKVRANGEVHLVVGDSKLRGITISNSRAAIVASEIAGLRLTESATREIPNGSRYLPTSGAATASLAKRMMIEHVLSFKN
jgi:hypothetical protein